MGPRGRWESVHISTWWCTRQSILSWSNRYLQVEFRWARASFAIVVCLFCIKGVGIHTAYKEVLLGNMFSST